MISAWTDRMNELVRSLRKQLEATERELARQKWVFDRFLESPSWRMTYPIRWMARQARAVRDWMLGGTPSASGRGQGEGHKSAEILKPSPHPLPQVEGVSPDL